MCEAVKRKGESAQVSDDEGGARGMNEWYAAWAVEVVRVKQAGQLLLLQRVRTLQFLPNSHRFSFSHVTSLRNVTLKATGDQFR